MYYILNNVLSSTTRWYQLYSSPVEMMVKVWRVLNFSLRGTKTKVVVEFLHVVACTNGRGGGGGWDEQPASRAQWIKKMKKRISNFLLDIIKVHISWEGHKILRILHLTYVLCSASQKKGEASAKFWGFLRIHEL